MKKQIMKIRITIFILLLGSLVYGQTGQKNFIDQNYIEVTGKAEMEIVPDEIYLEISINEKDYKGKQSLETLEKLMIEKLTGIGIDVATKLVIKDFVSNFKNYWIKSSTIYTSKDYQLLVNSANTAGQVFQELESIGISNISIGKIDHSEILQLKAEVKTKAIEAAKSKASSLAVTIDQSIGKAIFIKEIENFDYRGYQAELSNIMVSAYEIRKVPEQQKPNIEFEKIKLEYSILARFELN